LGTTECDGGGSSYHARLLTHTTKPGGGRSRWARARYSSFEVIFQWRFTPSCASLNQGSISTAASKSARALSRAVSDGDAGGKKCLLKFRSLRPIVVIDPTLCTIAVLLGWDLSSSQRRRAYFGGHTHEQTSSRYRRNYAPFNACPGKPRHRIGP